MYALFSQQKLVYTSLLAGAQTDLMNVTHQHENLALRSNSLKSTLNSIQERRANELSDLYEELSNSITASDYDMIATYGQYVQDEGGINETGLALEDADAKKAFQKTAHKYTKNKGTETETEEAYTKVEWLMKKYNLSVGDLTDIDSAVRKREDVDADIKALEQEFDAEEASLNKQIDNTALKETRLDTEKASIETKITDYQKQLEKIEEAEGKGIEASIGKFQGVG